MAAEIAVFDFYEELQYIENLKNQTAIKMVNLLNEKKDKALNICYLLNKTINLNLALAGQKCEMLKNSSVKAMSSLFENKKNNLNELVNKLEKSNPLSILKSGYAKVLKDNKSVNFKNINIGYELEVVVDSGVIYSRVEKLEEK